jgi:hypothetical protein
MGGVHPLLQRAADAQGSGTFLCIAGSAVSCDGVTCCRSMLGHSAAFVETHPSQVLVVDVVLHQWVLHAAHAVTSASRRCQVQHSSLSDAVCAAAHACCGTGCYCRCLFGLTRPHQLVERLTQAND